MKVDRTAPSSSGKDAALSKPRRAACISPNSSHVQAVLSGAAIMKISGRTFGTARKGIIAKIVNIYGPEPGSLPSTVAASVPRQTLRGELTDDSPRNLRFVRWLLPVSPQPIQEIILVDRLLHFGRDFSRILTHATAHLRGGGLEPLSDHLRLPLQLLPGLLPGSRGKQNPQPYSH